MPANKGKIDGGDICEGNKGMRDDREMLEKSCFLRDSQGRFPGGSGRQVEEDEGAETKGSTHFEVLVWSNNDQLPTGFVAFCWNSLINCCRQLCKRPS